MRYWIGWIAVGAVWGVVSVSILAWFGTAPSSWIHELVYASHYSTTHISMTLDFFSTDCSQGIFFFKPLFVPHVLGMDALAWTVGYGAWLFTRQATPWLALGRLLDPCPPLAATAVVAVNMLAGALIMTIPALILRLFMWLGDLCNRPPRSLTHD